MSIFGGLIGVTVPAGKLKFVFSVIVVVCQLFFVQTIQAATISAIQSGPWDDPATWSSGVPTSNDNALVMPGYLVDLTNAVSAECIQLTVDANAGMMFSGGDLLGTNIYVYGTATQDTGNVTFTGVDKQRSHIGSTNGAGYVMNGGLLSFNYSVHVGGFSGENWQGSLTVNGGTIAVSNQLVCGYGGYGRVIISGGVISNMNQVLLGQTPGSTGELELVSGSWAIANSVQLGWGNGAGRLNISGGSLSIASGGLNGDNGTNDVIRVIGAGCTNIDIGGDFHYSSFYGGVHTLQAYLDNSSNGISLIKASGYVIVTNINLEIGVTNGFTGTVGSTYEFIRAPEANAIYTNDWTVSSLDPNYGFNAYVTNYSTYDWVIIECTSVPAIYVDDDATGANDGSSWTDAYTNLQDALSAAVSNDQIWVAAGTYKPTTTTNRDISFQMKEDVDLYGGFDGTETVLNQRNWEANVTILSGDLLGDDVGFSNNADNAYHVVVGTNNATLDGFMICGGNADGGGEYDWGGGMYNTSASPIVNNCIFAANSAQGLGGGMCNQNLSSPTINHCLFSGNIVNTTSGDGGGMMNYSSAPNLSHCLFAGNNSASGGGIRNTGGTPVISNCLFVGNIAVSFPGGGMYSSSSSSPMIMSCSFAYNEATSGGGIYYDVNLNTTITNCIFWNNNAPSAAEIDHNVSATTTVSHCDIRGGWNGVNIGGPIEDGGGNIDADPLFVGGYYGIGGWMSDASFISNKYQSVLHASAMGWFANEHAGKFIQPDTNSPLQYLIVSNDSDNIAVWGDLRDLALTGQPYQIHDYHLKSTAGHWDTGFGVWSNDVANSPCIDAGDPTSDWSNEPSPNGSQINMGAYGNTPEASKSGAGGSPPVVQNGMPTDITNNAAYLNGNLASDGGSPTEVWIYWGLGNGFTNKLSWDTNEYFGVRSPGALWTNVTGLISSTQYFYRCYASNAYGEAWAPATSNFWTMAGGGSFSSHGTPHAWLDSFGLTDHENDDAVDQDADGWATWEEYIAGTDPTDPGSNFRTLDFKGNLNTNTITWYGTTNGAPTPFSVWRRTNLVAGSWTLITTNVLRDASGTNIWMDIAPGNGPNYYRVSANNTTNTVYTPNIVGALTTVIPSNSYTYLRLPFRKFPHYTGVISANTTNTITDASASWSVDRFAVGVSNAEPTGASTFYAVITDTNSAFHGRTFFIQNNSATVLTISGGLEPDVPGGGLVGVSYRIVPAMRMRDIFGEPGASILGGGSAVADADPNADIIYMWDDLGSTWDPFIYYRNASGFPPTDLLHYLQSGAHADDLIPRYNWFSVPSGPRSILIKSGATATNKVITLAGQVRSKTQFDSSAMYTITASSATPNGTITPTGVVSVLHGSDPFFAITPDVNCHITDVQVNGGSIGASNLYAFAGITSNSTINAYFAPNGVTLSIASAYGITTPLPGIYTNAFASLQTNSVTSPDTQADTQYVCTGWTMTGNIPFSGTNNWMTMTHTNAATLTWLWDTNYWLDISANPNGTNDTPNGWYAGGTNLTITATPSNGYSFVGWTDDVTSTNNPLNLTMDQAYMITPNFELKTNSVDIISDYGMPDPMTGTWWYAEGSVVTASVEDTVIDIDTQYVCVGWTGTGSATPSGSTTNTTFSITNNSSVMWNWLTNYSLTVSPDPNGSVDTPDGWYESGTNLSIAATASNAYVFAGWTGDIVSSDNPLSLLMDKAYNITPTFIQGSTVTILSQNPNNSVNITATPDLNGDTNVITAVDFVRVYTNGTIVSLTAPATAPNGNLFTEWQSSLGPTYATRSINITATADETLTATYITPRSITILSANPNTGLNITVSPADLNADSDGITAPGGFVRVYEDSANVTLIAPATAPGGNVFYRWQSSLGPTYTTKSINITATADETFTAVYGPGKTITVQSLNPTSGVTVAVSPNDIYANGAGSTVFSRVYTSSPPVTLTAPATVGANTFLKWQRNGADYSTNMITVVTMDADYIMDAIYLTPQYTITASAGANGSIAPSGPVAVNHGASQMFTITPDADYHIDDVTVDGPSVGTPTTYTFNNVTNNHTINAAFAVDVGSIRCFLYPPAARVAGAQFRVDGGAWRNHGASENNLPVTTLHTIQFRAVTGWNTPANINNVPVTDGATTDRNGTYIGLGMVQLADGTPTFRMGVYDSVGGTDVTLSPFQIDITEVTVGDYMAFANDTGFGMPPLPTGWADWASHSSTPIRNVKWNEAAAYAAWAGKCLPTEAQFEFAMRSGYNYPNDKRYTYGDDITTSQANFADYYGTVPSEVSMYPATPNYGLRDIAGNVWEWCYDWHSGTLPSGTDPQGPATGEYKCKRGGAWINPQSNLRCARRYTARPRVRYEDVGFRCVYPNGSGRIPDGDTNDNGVPDWWEMWYFGLSAGGAGGSFDASADSDGDGSTNAQEYNNGTDPTDPNSVFAINAEQLSGPNRFVMRWPSGANPRWYRIEKTTNFSTWTGIVSNLPSVTPPTPYTMAINVYTDVTADASAWYRLVVNTSPE